MEVGIGLEVGRWLEKSLRDQAFIANNSFLASDGYIRHTRQIFQRLRKKDFIEGPEISSTAEYASFLVCS